MKVSGICVEDFHLTLTGFNYTRVTMPHMTDVVDQVEVTSPSLIKKVLTPASYDLEGMSIGDAEVWAQVPLADRYDFICGTLGRIIRVTAFLVIHDNLFRSAATGCSDTTRY